MRETGANPVLSRNCKPDESPFKPLPKRREGGPEEDGKPGYLIYTLKQYLLTLNKGVPREHFQNMTSIFPQQNPVKLFNQ